MDDGMMTQEELLPVSGPLLGRLALWLQDFKSQVATGISGITFIPLGLIIGYQLSTPHWNQRAWFWIPVLLLVANICLAAAGVIWNCQQTQSTRALKEEVEHFKGEFHRVQEEKASLEDTLLQACKVCDNLFDEHAKFLSELLNFGDRERITVYKHVTDGFIPAGRYSSNPVLRERGRGFLPDGEGLVWEAWRYGHLREEFKNSPTTTKYARQHRARGLSDGVIKSLRMKSRDYVIIALDGNGGERLGVICFESERLRILDYNRLERLMQDPEGRQLVRLMDIMRDRYSMIDFARDMGF